MRGRVSVGIALLVLAGSDARAQAPDDKQACVGASEEAQKLRDEHALTKAREQLLVCTRESCPQVVRKDCATWLSEVEASLPSVVLSARSQGNDVTTARVLLDGNPLVEQLDGRAVFVDPGPHTFRFHVEGKPPVERQVVIKEGERNREIAVDIGAAPTPETTARSETVPPPAKDESKPSLVPAYVAGGVAVVGLGSFAFFGITGKSDVSSLRDGCGVTRSCSQSDVDAARTKLIIADVSLGVALVAAGVATYFFLSHGSGKAQAASALHVTAGPIAGGGGAAGVGGRF